MGTRADFYVGRGPQAEWIGSIAWDGYPSGLESERGKPSILAATTEGEFRAAVDAELASREDATTPDQGWPWPWNNSNTTDYSYAFDGGRVWGTCFGHGWWPVEQEPEDDSAPKIPDSDWPDMKSKQEVTFGRRSGAIFIQGGRIVE